MDVEIPRVAGSLEELVAGATDRVPVRSSDAKSGASFETLRIAGAPYFLMRRHRKEGEPAVPAVRPEPPRHPKKVARQ